jgi:uncharacterized protein
VNPDQVKYIVTEMFARYETQFRDPSKVLEFLHDDVDWWIAGRSAVSGHKNKLQMLETLAHLPHYTDHGMRIWPVSFIIEGDRAAVEGESYMKLKNGIEYTNQYHWMFEFRDGKIFQAKEYLDTALVAEVFGAPTPA